ncbi:MAG: lamin tail domain-containing protein [Fibrobacteria bacterium]
MIRALRPAAGGTAILVVAGLAGCGSLDSSTGNPYSDAQQALRFTEIHYHPADRDSVSGDDFEFLEIGNTGASTLSLNGIGITAGVDFSFPKGTSLEAGRYLVLAADAAKFKQRYGFAPFGTYTGKLNNARESLVLSNLQSKVTIDSVEYSDQTPWPALADGDGYSLVPASWNGAGHASAWRASFQTHGSPGKEDLKGVFVNEVLAHTDPPDKDAIELFNPNDAPVDIGGWFLTDKRADPAKFKIPAGTVIAAQGYLVFDEDDFNADTASPRSFRLDPHGEEVFLSADSLGCAGRFCDGMEYGEIENGITFGRYATVHGQVSYPMQISRSLGSANTGPRVGPVILSEVMYHPREGLLDSAEYVEVANISDSAVPLFNPAFPKDTWKIEGLGFEFPAGVTLAPREAVLILSKNLPDSVFRKLHGIADTIRIYTAQKRLSNDFDSLKLLKPEEPYVKGAGTVVPYMVIERMTYTDHPPWPGAADGDGKSLGRGEPVGVAEDAASWKAIEPSPGTRP